MNRLDICIAERAGISTVCLEHIVEFLEHQVEQTAPSGTVPIALPRPLLGKGGLQENGLSDWYCSWIARVPILQVFDVLEVRSCPRYPHVGPAVCLGTAYPQAADAMGATGPAEVAAARLASCISAMSVQKRLQVRLLVKLFDSIQFKPTRKIFMSQLFGRPDGSDMTEGEETRLREANAWAGE